MTIAACYLTAEGVVLGADSTSTLNLAGNPHFLNHAQKIFEVGEPGSTVGIVMWGLGGLQSASYRTLIAQFADGLSAPVPKSMADLADRWKEFFWDRYQADFAQLVTRGADLRGKTPRTPEEEKEFAQLGGFGVGFCLGGYLAPDRTVKAYEVVVDPRWGKLPPREVNPYTPEFWGAPNMMRRLLLGCDERTVPDVVRSGKWTGTEQELQTILGQYYLGALMLPIREAIDFVHSCIESTIKAMKFSHFNQVCGGAIEIAVITSDRRFRWVRHKQMDAAIGEIQEGM